MKKKIFFAALVLFIVFLNSMILLVSNIILKDKLSAVRDKCLAEHYVMASSLIGDMQALEQRKNHVEENIENLMRVYSRYLQGKGSVLAVSYSGEWIYESSAFASREKMIFLPDTGYSQERLVYMENGKHPVLCVYGSFPAPWQDYGLMYIGNLGATGTPTDTDLTMEEAAEAGRQYLENIFGLDLEGAYVYMSYEPGTKTFPRAFWVGDVSFEKERKPESTKWVYLIDAVTGELFNIGYDRQLDVTVPLDYDKALEKDYSIYAELAREKAEEWKLLDSPIDRVEYNCQGSSGNDPTIAVNVIGENGEIVNMDFSRYDQTFLGLITDASRKVTESVLDSLFGEVEPVETE